MHISAPLPAPPMRGKCAKHTLTLAVPSTHPSFFSSAFPFTPMRRPGDGLLHFYIPFFFFVPSCPRFFPPTSRQFAQKTKGRILNRQLAQTPKFRAPRHTPPPAPPNVPAISFSRPHFFSSFFCCLCILGPCLGPVCCLSCLFHDWTLFARFRPCPSFPVVVHLIFHLAVLCARRPHP